MPDSTVVSLCEGLCKHRRGDLMIFTIDGENSRSFQGAIRDAVLEETGDVAIHVRRLKMINSSFLGLLMHLFKNASRHEHRFLLLNPYQRLRDLILIMALHQELEILTTIEDLPPESLGLPPLEKEEIQPGLHAIHLRDLQILSLDGEVDPTTVDRSLEIIEATTAPIVLHIGALRGADVTSLHERLGRVAAASRPGGKIRLLNPSIEFHDHARKTEIEPELAIVTALDGLFADGNATPESSSD